MRYYGIIRKRYFEKIMYSIVKLKRFCSQYTTLDKNTCKRRKFAYIHSFVEPHRLREENLGIPERKYYIPICIITSDLVLRENIPQLKSGLLKLLKKQYSHKFFGGQKSIDEIIRNIEEMDDTRTSWYNCIDIGRFDFERDSSLNQAISYFDVYIKNVNSSYLSIEFHLYLAGDYQRDQIQIINNNYLNIKGYIVPGFTQNRKVSGGKRTYNVTHYNNAYLKSDLIYESISLLKWRFYNKIQRFFPTILHQKNVNPPSINIFKTDINYKDETARHFWDSVGISSYQGQFIDESRKLFFKINLSGRYERNKRTDLIYVVNELTIEHERGYYSIDFQIVNEFAENLSTDIFKFALLDALNELVANDLISYKSSLNKIKLRKNRLNKLLRLRYLYEKDIDFYRRYVCDDIWGKAQNKIANVFDGKKLKHSYDYRFLTDSSVVSKGKIIKQLEALCTEFDEKTSILQHLAAYKNEKRNRIINFIMLMLTIATIVFIIFPELSKEVAKFLLYIWRFTKDIFEEIR